MLLDAMALGILFLRTSSHYLFPYSCFLISSYPEYQGLKLKSSLLCCLCGDAVDVVDVTLNQVELLKPPLIPEETPHIVITRKSRANT